MSKGISVQTLASIFTAVHSLHCSSRAPQNRKEIVEHVTPQQDKQNVKNMGIEVIEKVKKHYVMERMTSGLIRCLGKSTMW